MKLRCEVSPSPHAVAALLSKRYGDCDHYNRANPLSELLFIICSLQTNEPLYRRTFAALRSEFRTFESLALAPERTIARVIAPGGLARQKAHKIKRILDAIVKRFGKPTLAPLRKMPETECEDFLLALPGVGKKTARCVMMYSFGHAVFPVDVHCWRISQRLGWIRATRPDETCSSADMDRLQSIIPRRIRRSLHVNFVSLGRSVCTAKSPRCDDCALALLCTMRGTGDRR